MATRKALYAAEQLVVVRGWGRSLGIVLPKNVAAELHVQEGSTAVVSIHDGHMVLTPQTGQQGVGRARRPFSFYAKRATKLGLGKPAVDEIFPRGTRGGELL